MKRLLSPNPISSYHANRISEQYPQGGPLSPLLSNLVLDELDRELERRGHRFVRYADDSAPRAQRGPKGPRSVQLFN